MHGELVVDLLAVLLSDELSLLSLLFGDRHLELGGDLTSGGVIESVQELSDYSEGFGHNAADFAGVIACLAGLHGKIYDADTSKRGGQPQLLIV